MRYRSDPTRIRGSIAALVTPFTDGGDLDVAALRALTEWQIEQGSHGISIGGSTGEPSAQTGAERLAAMSAVAEVVADRVPFLPGTGSSNLAETLWLTGQAERLGADAALVITPYYARPTQDGLYTWYSTVAREYPDLPLVIYNVPSRTSVDVHPATVARLRRDHGNIVGIKETTRDFEHFSQVLHACGRDFLMWSGIELLCLPLLALGGAGFVGAAANIAPAAVARMYEDWVGGDHPAALDAHYALHPLVEMIFVETNPAPLKWAMRHLGLLPSGHVRPPLVGPGEAARARILALLDQSRDIVPQPVVSP